MDRLSAAEAKIQQLETQISNQNGGHAAGTQALPPDATVPPQNAVPAPVPAAATAAQTAPEPAPAEEESHEHMMAIPGGPELKIRGFFDFNFDKRIAAQNLQYPVGATPNATFRAGEFDLFITSQLSEHLSFLAEAVFSTDQTNSFGVDLERFQLTYRPSRYFEISGGRFHTAIGYYITILRFIMAIGFRPLRVGHLCTTSKTAAARCPCTKWA